MKGPESYFLVPNPAVVRSAMKFTGDNIVDLQRWLPSIKRNESGLPQVGDYAVHPGEWVLLNESTGDITTVLDRPFFQFWQFYETPEKRAVREAEAKDAKAQREEAGL
jgi:poly(3-hydroxyalkanoate) synthetase